MSHPDYRISSALQWLGWDRTRPTVAAVFTDEALYVVAVRTRPARITASGMVPLAPGIVRKGELRLVSIGADALKAARTHLALTDISQLTIVVNPTEAVADPVGDSVRTRVDKHQLEALALCGQIAGFATTDFDPRPAAAARVARFGSGTDNVPLYVGGAGWLSVMAGPIRDVVAGGSFFDPTSVGPSPSTMMPITRPDPVRVASGVDLVGPWPLLLGAALARSGQGPIGHVEARDYAPTSGWAGHGIHGAVR